MLILIVHPIIVLKGGLGNQLFQWYFAHGISPIFTYTFFRNDSRNTKKNNQLNLNPIVREFELELVHKVCQHKINIPSNSMRGLYYRKFPRISTRLWDITLLQPLIHKFGYLRDDPRHNVKSSFNSPKKIRIADGYFQESKYVEQVWENVSSELEPVLKEVYSIVRNRLSLPENFQVIHVRRPDQRHHLSSPLNLGALDSLYFSKASENIPKNNRILLISDRNEIGDICKLIKPKFLFDSNETSAWEALAIMCYAENLIGSNSTLSWWGARMCSANGGKAFLPDKWSVNENFDTKNLFFDGLSLVPTSWISGAELQY